MQEAFDLWRVLEDEAPAVGELLTITGGVSQGSLASREVADAFVARGIPHEWLSAADAHARWPGLAFEGDVLHETSTAGRLHADRAVEAFLQAAVAAGARVLHETPVVAVEQTGDGVRVVTDTGTWHASSVVVAVGAWTSGLLAGIPELADRLVVTQEQPAHFALRPDAPAADLWPSFTHDPPAPHPWPSGVYGLATPGEGIKVGFHAVGPRTDPDRRTFTPEPGQLRRCATTWRSGCPAPTPTTSCPISCTYTTTPDHDFVLDRRGTRRRRGRVLGARLQVRARRRPRARRPRVRARTPRAARTPPSPPPGSRPCRSDPDPHPGAPMTTNVPLSILELATVGVGQTGADALRATLDLAVAADRLGYRRLWFAEHHLAPGVASASPAVLAALAADRTRRLRVGSGAVLLGTTSPLIAAEQFGTIAALHPGRVDLGLGRAFTPPPEGFVAPPRTSRAGRRRPARARHAADRLHRLVPARALPGAEGGHRCQPHEPGLPRRARAASSVCSPTPTSTAPGTRT